MIRAMIPTRVPTTVGRQTASALLLMLGLLTGGCASKSPAAPASAVEAAPPPVEAQPTDVGAPVDGGPVLPPGLAPLPLAEDAPRPGAAAPPPTSADGDGEPGTPPLPVVACTAFQGNAVKRSALVRTLDGGLGAWLSGVEIEPKVERGRFQGWLIQAIYPGDPCWTDVDLRAGDVVTKVNRRPIHSPDEAQAVWTALRSSREIVVNYLREGKPRTLRFPVVNDRE